MGALRDDRDANAILAESGEEALRDMLDGAIKPPGKKKPKERTAEEKLKAVDGLLRNGIEDEAAALARLEAADADYTAAWWQHACREIDAATLEEKRKLVEKLTALWRALRSDIKDAPDPGEKPSEGPDKTDETPPNAGNGRDTGETPPDEDGAYHIIGDLEASKKLCIAKGVATATAIYKATGAPCAAVGDMLAAAKALKLSRPDIEFIICADDDWKTKGNPGKTEGRKAALAIGARLAVPDFGLLSRYRKERDTSFSDLDRLDREHSSALEGCWAVSSSFWKARIPGSELSKFKTTRCRDIELSFEDEWIIEDLLPGSGFGTIFGPPGCGKASLRCIWSCTLQPAYPMRDTPRRRCVSFTLQPRGSQDFASA